MHNEEVHSWSLLGPGECDGSQHDQIANDDDTEEKEQENELTDLKKKNNC